MTRVREREAGAGPRRDWLVAAVATLGVVIGGYLTVTKLTRASALLCEAGSGCDVIQASPYALLLGVPTALWGAGLRDVPPGVVEKRTGVPAAYLEVVAREFASNQPGLAMAGDAAASCTNGAFNLKVIDLNQNILRSFLASALGDKKLASISINANAGAKCDAGREASVKPCSRPCGWSRSGRGP